MRRAAKVDRPQAEITDALRQCAISVQPLHSVGKGVPDLLCGFRGINVLLELKDGTVKPSARKLTADETAWHGKWSGQVAVVGTAKEAIDAVIAEAKKAGRI